MNVSGFEFWYPMITSMLISAGYVVSPACILIYAGGVGVVRKY